MTAAARAGAFYALIVFLIGFVLGTGRVLLLAPRLGETTAVCVETPLILAASWFVCRWSVDRLDVPRRMGPRSLMGVTAFAVLIAAEFAVGRLIYGRPIGEQFAAYGSAPGGIGVAAQVAFATFPVIQIWRR